MSLLTPLGLLGLIGLIVLIIIYIIKPIFQNKIISSTYVWKRSLKYRKKKIPISQLRNILIFICQVLIITSIAVILAQPFINDEEAHKGESTVVVIDASASMLAETGGSSRFDRAITAVTDKVDEVFADETAAMSVIIASDKPYFVAQEAKAESAAAIKSALRDILYETDGKKAYTYGSPDMAGAMKLAEEITAYNANSKVLLYTDTDYIAKGKVEIVPMADPSDWNAAILDVRASIVENFYRFEVDVACYGKDEQIDVQCNFYGVNTENSNLPPYTMQVKCTADQVKTLIFSAKAPENEDEEKLHQLISIYEYNYVHVTINENDSLSVDNTFFLYGGKRPTLKVQYKSTLPNNFYASALMVLRDRLGDYWDIDIDELKANEEPKTEGYDIYIFEHMVPTTIPTDGIVILSDPDALPSRLGIQLGNGYQSQSGDLMYMTMGEAHPVTNKVIAENIGVSKFVAISNYDDYTPLLYCNDKVVAAVKNTDEEKLVVMSFNMNYSNFALLPDFPLFLYNLVNYFTPMTIDGFVYDVNSTVDIYGRAEYINITGPDTEIKAQSYPYNLSMTAPGVYTVTQKLISEETVFESFYVKIPESESNINLVVEKLDTPFFYQEPEGNDVDLLIYFAIALVALLFIEWWLKSREQA